MVKFACYVDHPQELHNDCVPSDCDYIGDFQNCKHWREEPRGLSPRVVVTTIDSCSDCPHIDPYNYDRCLKQGSTFDIPRDYIQPWCPLEEA